MSNQLVKYEIDGGYIYIEAAKQIYSADIDTDISNDGVDVADGGKFDFVIQNIKPVADVLLKALKELNEPTDVELEMGLKFGAKTGVIFASADSEATFKVTLKWHNK
jgi:hypothetical protein